MTRAAVMTLVKTMHTMTPPTAIPPQLVSITDLEFCVCVWVCGVRVRVRVINETRDNVTESLVIVIGAVKESSSKSKTGSCQTPDD